VRCSWEMNPVKVSQCDIKSNGIVATWGDLFASISGTGK
jgi:hypothetical protein